MLIGHDAEPCPNCGDDDLRLWHSHYCQAFFVICNNCQHEDGREREEHQAVTKWNREARKMQHVRTLTERNRTNDQ